MSVGPAVSPRFGYCETRARAASAASPSCLLVVMPIAWISTSGNASLLSLFRPLLVHFEATKTETAQNRVVCAAVFVLDIQNRRLEG